MENQIELRAERMQELLGPPPGGLIRYGIGVFFFIVVLLFVFCSIFKYPETYPAEVEITSEYPSVWLVAQSTGKIDTVAVENNSMVEKGQLLAVIHNVSKFNDVQRLKEKIDSLQSHINSFDIRKLIFNKENLQVGALQEPYIRLYTAISEYRLFYFDNLQQIQEKSVKEELEEMKQFMKILQEQNEIKRESNMLSYRNYLRDSAMYEMNGISMSDLEQSKQVYLHNRIEYSQSKLALSNAAISIKKLENALLELKNNFTSKEEMYQSAILAYYEQMKTSLDAWENLYVLRAPSDGMINFSRVWSKNQFVNAGEKCFAIIPHHTGKIIGKCSFSVKGSGKLKEGQVVFIKLDEYPYMEFGMLKGTLRNISGVSSEIETYAGRHRFVTADIYLTDGFTSTYGIEIPYSGQLSGSIEVVILEKTLLRYFLDPLKHIWTKNLKQT